ncbi:winged helix-turn-helix transcriptional regulator [Marinicella sp. W31]|uniref:winged helix-turn-helix transcriptional regulator n=1 Tax=Marinicella sp. W31 TaxID=3023713 RepID=UPI003757D7B4
MKSTYGQYCPLALAVEVLSKRWTILVISRLLDGCCQFNEIHRGIPRISPSLLTQRLTELEDYGLIFRQKLQKQRGYSYHLTEAGEALENIVMDMAIWGQQWARDMNHEDLDPAFLAWSMHLRMNTQAMPKGRTVIEFLFTGVPQDLDRFWIVNLDGKVEMCLKNPGYEADVFVFSDIRDFIEVWRGFKDIHKHIRTKKIILRGSPLHVKAFPDWLRMSALAKYKRLK